MTFDPNDPKTIEKFAEDLRKIPRVVLVLEPIEAFALVASIQLSLRHPGNVGDNAERTRKIKDLLIKKLGKTDVLRFILEAGDNPDFDVQT